MRKNGTRTREQRLEEALEPWMLGITALLVPVLVLPVFVDVSRELARVLELFNIFIWLAFYGELFLKLAVSSDWKKTLQRNPILVLILLSPLLVPLRILRIVRVVHAVRVLRLQRIVRYFKPKMQSLVLNLEQMFFSVGIFVLVSGFLIWQVELHNNGTIVEYDDALWWAVITITTVGYGDVIPSTPEGRIIGALVSLVGIILFMVLVARTTAYFVENKELIQLHRTLRKIEDEID